MFVVPITAIADQSEEAHEVPRAVPRWRAAVRGVAAWWSAQYDQWGCMVSWNACGQNNAQDEELKERRELGPKAMQKLTEKGIDVRKLTKKEISVVF